MARKAKNKPNDKLAQKFRIEPVDTILTALAWVGKPVYFIFSGLWLYLIFTASFLGQIIFLLNQIILNKAQTLFLKQNGQRRKKRKTTAKKRHLITIVLPIIHRLYTSLSLKTATLNYKIIKSLKTLRTNFPTFSKPDISKFLRLKELKLVLFKLKIISKFKIIIKKKFSRREKLKIKLSVIFIFLFTTLVTGVSLFYFYILKTLPSPDELANKSPQVSTKIYDRNGNLLYKIYKDQNRSIVPLSQIPVHVRLATLAAEDAEFYNHPGFSLKGISRALIEDAHTGSLQGGSTITQQLVKNVLLTPEKTLIRKIKEIILSVEVETTYTKDQILEMYLNQVSFGGTSYGIQEAAQEYFGKNVGELDLAEAAFLAGLTQSPTTYSPYGAKPEEGIARQRDVLHLMTINKFITSEQERITKEEKLTFIAKRSAIRAPHFVMYIRNLLVQKYGEEMVEKGGLEVTTSLDLQIQEMAERIVKEEVNKLKGLNVGNGAALVVNPTTGEILAMVGSTDYFNAANDGQVNVTLRLRQPGSSIKVVNYAYALSLKEYTPATLINDSPITFVTAGSPPYSPVNYDGQYRGNVTLRSALAQSRNIPAVKILASYGVSKMINQGILMGITSWGDPSKYGLSLTLGGGAVTALDLSKVYSTLANGGKRPETLPVLQVKNYKGKLLEKNSANVTQVLDPRVSYLLTDILKDNHARSPEFGFNSYLVIKDHPEVAVKTGTSNDLRDNWTAGYSQKYLVITWVGNNNNAPMSRIASGITGASPIWNKIMSTLLSHEPSNDWTVPGGLVKVNCPGGKSEWFKDDNVLSNFCSPPPPSPTPSPIVEKPDKILNGVFTRARH